jgi:hypothetical protein
MIETIAGVQIPDSRIANDAAELIFETTTPLIVLTPSGKKIDRHGSRRLASGVSESA